MRSRTLLAAVLIIGALVGVLTLLVGADDEQRPASSMLGYAVTSGPMTTDVPGEVRRVCTESKALRTVTVPVSCPLRVPAGRIDTGLGAGMLVFCADPRLYILAFYSNQDPKLRRPAEARHWMAGAGKAPAMRQQAFSDRAYVGEDGAPQPERVVTAAGREVRVYRSPPFPRGGMFGGHVTATTEADGLIYLGSVHGYEHVDMAIAIMLSTVAAEPRARRPSGRGKGCPEGGNLDAAGAGS